jgi:hypothetical protein
MAPRSVRFGVRSRKLSNVYSVIGWVTKNLLSRAPPCFVRHAKPLVPAAFAMLAPTNPHWARVVGYGSFSLCVIHKEGLCPSIGDINRLTMMTVEVGTAYLTIILYLYAPLPLVRFLISCSEMTFHTV